jgi:transposase-like protein
MTRDELRALRIRQLEGWRSSGLTQEAYCKREGIACETFRRWRRRLAERAGALPATVRLVPVHVGDTPSQLAFCAGAESTDVLTRPVEVVLASGRRLRFADGLEEAGLARLIRLLEVLPC